jgi:hypothetical protein
MANFVFAQGTKVTWQQWDKTKSPWELIGVPVEFKAIKSVGASTKTRSIADVTTLKDDTVRKMPAKRDLGSLQLTFNLLDEAAATNERVLLGKAWQDGEYLQIVLDLPGDFDDVPPSGHNDNTMSFDGFISSISTPEVAVSDEPLTYTVEFTLTKPMV